MRFLTLYLVGYFILVLGAVLVLWQANILREIPGAWLAIGGVIAVGVAIVLAIASGAPTITRQEQE